MGYFRFVTDLYTAHRSWPLVIPVHRVTLRQDRAGTAAAAPVFNEIDLFVLCRNNTERKSKMANVPQNDLWVGLLSGAIGVIAMDLFSQGLVPLLTSDNDDEQKQGQGQPSTQSQPLDDISLIGQHHRPQESATAALGRIIYQSITGDEPGKETKPYLSYGVHWGYGIAQGGLYDAWQAQADEHSWSADLTRGLTFGTALWLFGDEGAVPLLGLQDGPTASSVGTHAQRLAMHLVYGAATAAAYHTLKRVV
jgi:hypothetical protein